MGLFWKKQTESVSWGVWKMEESWDELCEQLQNPDLVKESCKRFKAPHRRMEWLSVRRLLQTLTTEPLNIIYQPNGKPILDKAGWHISISHTKGYVAVIFGPQLVGIDIEQYGQRVHRVAQKFMRSDEICNPYQGDDTWSLLLHWSAKETLFKCLDATEVDFRKHLQICPFTLQKEGCLEAREYKTAQQRHFTLRYALHPDFVLTYLYNQD